MRLLPHDTDSIHSVDVSRPATRVLYSCRLRCRMPTEPPPEKQHPVPELGTTDDVSPPRGAAFPIVGIGASAGGLEAFQQLLRALPVDTGMAFVLIQHLDPHHESEL